MSELEFITISNSEYEHRGAIVTCDDVVLGIFDVGVRGKMPLDCYELNAEFASR